MIFATVHSGERTKPSQSNAFYFEIFSLALAAGLLQAVGGGPINRLCLYGGGLSAFPTYLKYSSYIPQSQIVLSTGQNIPNLSRGVFWVAFTSVPVRRDLRAEPVQRKKLPYGSYLEDLPPALHFFEARFLRLVLFVAVSSIIDSICLRLFSETPRIFATSFVVGYGVVIRTGFFFCFAIF